MLAYERDKLLLSLRPAAQFRPIPPIRDRRTWDNMPLSLKEQLSLRAQQAMAQPLAPLTATMYLSGQAYQRQHLVRRELLKALVMGSLAEGADKYRAAIVDLIWATLEESSWQLPDANGGLRLDPRIDLAAAETACLLALCCVIMDAELDSVSPAIRQRIEMELDARIFEPLLSEQPGALALHENELIRAADALMGVVLLMERSEKDRWLCMRQVLPLMERHLAKALPDGGFSNGLERHMPDVFALSNCLFMIAFATGGELELRDEPDFARAAQIANLLHIGGGWFLNPGGDGARPVMDLDALYRLGDGARSAETCAFAAYLMRPGVMDKQAASLMTAPLMHQLLGALYRNDFMKEPARTVMRKQVSLPDMQLMSAHEKDWFFALSGGENREGSHLDVGDFTLFSRGKPIIIDPGADAAAAMHSVPMVDGVSQNYTNKPPMDGIDQQIDSGYSLFSLGIAHAYPPAARLVSWQRTLMCGGFDGGVRLMDVVELERGMQSLLVFPFMTPIRPIVEDDAILLGDVRMSWEGALVPRMEQVVLTKASQRALWGDQCYRVVLTTQEPVAGGTFAFVFQEIEGQASEGES
ncbi:hypothetical protein LJC33_02475 [Eubacteriales bacterium OttesenSCG-928-N13]|nr:hypothetical protein [Eubacteriales bacterium OttesenSCG-928-N13]